MPDRGWRLGFGLAVLALLAGLVGGAFAALFAYAGGGTGFSALASDAYLRGVVLFTLEQAALSTLLSLGFGCLFALALHRTRFPGRALLVRLLILTQALPVLVGALAILAVWGRSGLVSEALVSVGLGRLDVYGLSGILLAHTFFNMPLAARLVLSALDEVPAESWKLAGQMSLGPLATWRIVEAPAVLRAVPGAASLIFMLCMTSFTLVLVLGGGPGATTLQVEIYQALRADFDPARAALLGLAQIALTLLVLATILRLRGAADAFAGLGRTARRYDRRSCPMAVLSGLVCLLGGTFVIAPFAAVIWRGLAADLPRLVAERAVHEAAATSLAIALASAGLSLLLSAGLLLAGEALRSDPRPARRGFRAVFDLSGSLVLVVPPIVLGAGWFLALRAVADAFALAPAVIVTANAMMAMPFVTRILGPALAEAGDRHGRLAAHLGLAGLARLRLVEGPALRAPLGLAFAYALALSLGDLGVVTIFGNEDLVTLPLLLYQRLGSYRTADAAGLALLLGLGTLLLVVAAERLFARRIAAPRIAR